MVLLRISSEMFRLRAERNNIMSKEKFVDGNLVKIRDQLAGEKLSDNNSNSSDKSAAAPAMRSSAPAATATVINDREWKKALFRRWDEFRSLRRDVIVTLNELITEIPENIDNEEKRIADMKDAQMRLKSILDDIEAIDDSSWDRHSLISDLPPAMRKVENARMDSMLISAKLADKRGYTDTVSGAAKNSSVIHELNSVTFAQGFRLGLGFFSPLILGILVAVLIFSIFYYISLHF